MIPEPQVRHVTSLWKFLGHEPARSMVSRYHQEKHAVKTGALVAKAGVGIAKEAYNIEQYALIAAVASGAAVSATGVGLVAASLALSLGSAAFAGRSAYKTHRHIQALQAIQAAHDSLGYCGPVFRPDGPEFRSGLASKPIQDRCHRVIRDDVLPYILGQKESKRLKKGISAVPIIGGKFVGIHRLGRRAYKDHEGTLGVDRTNAATWLTLHLLCANCALGQAIVAALYSTDEMFEMMHLDGDQVVAKLASKMKSI